MFASIYIPDFSLQAALRHQADLRSKPVGIIDPALSNPAIVEANAAAKEFGVGKGLTASQAMARCGKLTIKTRSPAQEQAATEILLQTAYAFSANIESTAPGGCTMELKGLGLSTPTALQSWAAKILAALAPFHLEAHMGIAATPALSWLAARRARPISIVENPAEFVSVLPVAMLEPSPEIAEILERWGIHTAGDFLALGKGKIAERLGADALDLFDRVSADLVRPLKLVAPPEHFSEQIEFESGIETAEPLLFVLRRFVEQLSRRLAARYFIVAELQLDLGLFSGPNYQRIFKIPAPTGNGETLFRMLRTHLETVRTDAPIVSLRLGAKPSQPEAHQFGLFEVTLRNPNQFAETLARLGALCGSENVGTPVLEATHRPDAFGMRTPDFSGQPALSRHRSPGLSLRRFRPVLGAAVKFCEEQPAWLQCPIFNGVIAKTRGPFNYSGEWWDDHRWSRQEWDVETFDGSLFRIFRSGEGCFVEGVYD